MADIAQIGFKADTSDLVDAKAKLEAIVPSAAKVTKSANDTAAAFVKVDAAAAGISTGTTKAAAALNAAAGATDGARTSVDKLAAANDNLRAKYNPLYAVITKYKASVSEIRAAHASGAISADEMTAALNRLRTASLASIAAVKGQSGAVMAAAGGMKLRTDEMLNLSRQAADVGVTLAMGMSPLMVAIQQGPQIADVFATASARGMGFKAVLAQIGTTFYAVIAPFLPIIVGIGLAFGAVAAAFGLGARQINDSSASVTAGMDLTTKQLAKLKKEGVDTTVTIGDTFKAFFEVTGERLAEAFKGPLKSAGDAFSFFFDNVTKGGLIVIKGIIGGFVGAVAAIKAGWSDLPRALGDLTVATANAVISGVESMTNRAIGGFNKLIAAANPLLGTVGLSISQLATVQFGRINNSFAGAGRKFAEETNAAFKTAVKSSDAAVDRFFTDVGKRARTNRQKIIREAAGDRPSASGSKGGVDKAAKPDKEKFDDGFIIKDYDWSDQTPTPGFKADDMTGFYDRLGVAVQDYQSKLEFARDLSKGFFADLQADLRAGEGLWQSFGNAALNVLNKIFNKLLDKTLDTAINALFPKIGFAAKGAAFDGASAFAKGDAFTNSIVNSPTAFKFGKGGANLGIMGEAGPEAVMPLQRGADGSLGVQMFGKGKGGPATFAPEVNVNNTYVLAGAVSLAEVQRSIQQSAEQTRQDVRKSIPAVLQEYQMNGALA